LGSNDGCTVDQKSGGALHAYLLAHLFFLSDNIGVFSGIKAFVKLRRIQSDLTGKFFEMILTEGTLIFAVLVLIEKIIVIPEGILVGGTFTGFGCPLRFWTQEGEVKADKTDFTANNVCFSDLTLRVSGKSAAIWSLKIAETVDCHRCIRVPQGVTLLAEQEAH